MSIFEDVVEVWTNASNRIEDEVTPTTLARAVHHVDRDPDDLVVVVDWESLEDIADQCDIYVPYDGLVPRKHVNLAEQVVGQRLGGKTIVCGADSGTRFAVVIDSASVTYDNSILDHAGVCAVDFVEVADV